ncbi:MAG: glucose-1-phosphate cytidylyltransferase [Ruminococcus sp.]|nr:glucose-1-phosphate cytidylyltransferase [Ruminococcus sp.]
MKVVILAGGFGTRISEESEFKPKPMIEIGGKPILWHIMKCYSYYGFHEFIICAGYKQNVIKEYFSNYFLYGSDVTFDFSKENSMTVHNNVSDPWKVTVVDTGLNTLTGGRIKRVQPYIGNEDFMLTYGDGVSDINISRLLDFHKEKEKKLTITAVQPGNRFGSVEVGKSGEVKRFAEKKKNDGGWINGGFMVVSPEIFDYIDGDDSILEKDPMETFVKRGEMAAYCYDGFWQCMDTLRDKKYLEDLILQKKAYWMVWE